MHEDVHFGVSESNSESSVPPTCTNDGASFADAFWCLRDTLYLNRPSLLASSLGDNPAAVSHCVCDMGAGY